MVYLLVLGIIAASTVKGYSGKRLSCFIRCSADSYIFNFIRMIFCILIGFAWVLIEKSGEYLLPEGRMIAICVLAGISNSAFLVCWMLAVRVNSMAAVDVGLTLGSLIPSLLCYLLFGEKFSILKMIGFLIILFATYILSSGKKNDKKQHYAGIILLVLASVGEGMNGFSQQLYKQYYTNPESDVYYPKTIFHLYTYIFAGLSIFAFLSVYMLLERRKKSPGKENASEMPLKNIVTLRSVIHVFVMAVCLFISNYMQTVATSDYGMSSQLMYPILRAGCLVTVSIVAMAFFGEKITRRSIFGSLVAIVGIVAMSVL